MIKYNSDACQVESFNHRIPILVSDNIHVPLTVANFGFGVHPQTCRQISTTVIDAWCCIVLVRACFIPAFRLVRQCDGVGEPNFRLDPVDDVDYTINASFP